MAAIFFSSYKPIVNTRYVPILLGGIYWRWTNTFEHFFHVVNVEVCGVKLLCQWCTRDKAAFDVLPSDWLACSGPGTWCRILCVWFYSYIVCWVSESVHKLNRHLTYSSSRRLYPKLRQGYLNLQPLDLRNCSTAKANPVPWVHPACVMFSQSRSYFDILSCNLSNKVLKGLSCYNLFCTWWSVWLVYPRYCPDNHIISKTLAFLGMHSLFRKEVNRGRFESDTHTVTVKIVTYMNIWQHCV